MKLDITENDNKITISSSQKLLTVSDFSHSNVFDTVSKIKLTSDECEDFEDDSITHITDFQDYFVNRFRDVKIFTFIKCDVIAEDFENNLKVLNSHKGFTDAEININHIVYINRVLSKKDLFKAFKLISNAKNHALSAMNLPVHIQNILNTDDFLCVMCNVSDEYEDLNLNLKDAVEITTENVFKKLDLTCGILDYLVSEAIQIEALVDAAVIMNHSTQDNFKSRLHRQIIKSLTDINVITLIMASIRVDSDISLSHIREIKSSDKSFYADKTMALSLANQIGGGAAIFNFYEYNRYQPGVLSELPLIFTGLVAGCVSKVMEES